MPINSVVLIGAGGRLGAHVLTALKDFNVTVLARRSSASTFNDKVIHIADDYPFAELVKAFQGQDAVVSIVAGMAVDTQKSMVDAAIEAGVKLFIPSEFGTDIDTDSDAFALFNEKKKIREYLRSKESNITWTAIFCGAFFEMSLELGLMRIDISKREATVLDTGNARFPMSTWRTVSHSVAGVLRNPDACKNRDVFVQSFSVTQNMLREEMEKVIRGKISVTETLDSTTFIPQKERDLKQHGATIDLYHLIWALLVSGNDWSGKLDNKICGISEEDLGTEVDRVVRGMLDKH